MSIKLTQLIESPDKTVYGYWNDTSEAYPFGWKSGKLVTTETGATTHAQIGGRSNLKWAGRIWLDNQVISFWEYPQTLSEWRRVFGDLKRQFGDLSKFELELPNKDALQTKHAQQRPGDGFWKGTYVKVSDWMKNLTATGAKVGKRDAEELGQQHVISPLKKKQKAVPKGLGSKKLAGGLTATQMHQLMRTSEQINESPDWNSKLDVDWTDRDARPFGWWNGRFVYDPKNKKSSEPMTHGELFPDKKAAQHHEPRDLFKWPGRIWLTAKIISFWKYPKSVSDWKKAMQDLSRAYGNLSGFKIELPRVKGQTDIGDDSDYVGRVVNVKDFMDSLTPKKVADVGSRDKKELGQQHVMSPLKKKQKQVPMGLGSKKRPGGLTATQMHQLTRTSENTMKLSSILLEQKVRRAMKLVEQFLVEAPITSVSQYFVIGPDGKLVNVTGPIEYHGYALLKYPKLMELAMKEFKMSKEGILGEAEAGSDDLYYFMYKKGFIRGGKGYGEPWFAFDKKTLTTKTVTTMLAVLKKLGSKQVSVEPLDGRYESYSIEEFIEKFL